MKKTLAVFTVLLLTALGFLTVFQYTLLKEKDQVTFADEILYGDASDAEGLSVTTNSHYDRHLVWNTTYQAGPKPSVSTDYKFYSTDHRVKWDFHDTFYIDLDVQSYYLDLNKPKEEHTGIDRAFYDLYCDDTVFYKDDSNALTKSRLIQLKNYYEYYPFNFHVTIDDDMFFYSTVDQTVDSHETELAPLEDFFRIPIIEDDTRMINIQSFGKDDFSTFISDSNDKPSYYFNNYGVVTEDALFFTFTVDDSLGNGDCMSKLDFSHIPGGYGIYRIPYTTEETKYGTKHHINGEDVSMVYPLDSSISLFSFTTNKDRTKLFLSYQDKNTQAATTEFAVIDAKTMETLQLIHLKGIQKDDGSTETMIPYDYCIEEGYVIIHCSTDYLVVLELQDSGLYEYKFTINIHENPIFEYYLDIPWRTAVSWNGEKLAIAGANNRDLGTNRYALSCGFYIAVFDENGLIYYSEHDSSLDQGPSPMGPYTPVQPLYTDDGNTLLTVEWSKIQ